MTHIVRAGIVIALILGAIIATQSGSAAPPGSPYFERTWKRTDKPVSDGTVARTWIWGPEASGAVLLEEYQESPGNQRIVLYYDKSRMEITQPDGDASSFWYVTNGLLAKELITGRRQTGDDAYVSLPPAQLNVAGDSDDSAGPTYATFSTMLALPAVADESAITQRIDRAGQVTDDPALASQGVTAAYRLAVPGIDHQVASPFWAFMNSTATVWEHERLISAPLFQNPFYATGYPITEAYWANVKVGNTQRDVLLQCFERRCLTYTPGNPTGWEVEAGNVGQHYYAWRYADSTPIPAPTAVVTPTVDSSSTPIVPGGDDSIELLDVGFGQAAGSGEVGYGFVVRSLSGETLDSSEYVVVAYDASGEPLESDFGFIDLLLPGETRGLGGSIFVPEGSVAATVEVQVTSGNPTTSDFPQPFSASHPTYFSADFFPVVTALVSSPYDQPVEDLDVNVLLYNAAGDIIGGGYDFVDFILPGQSTGTEVYVAGSAAPVRIDVYAAPSSFTVFTSEFDAPGTQPSVVQTGWGGDPEGFDVGYGAIFENSNGGMIIDHLRYQATAFDADGRVLTIDSSYLSGMFPSERFGVGGTFYPPEGTVIARIEFQVLATNFVESTQGNPFSVSEIAWDDDPFYPIATGAITNNFGGELDSVEIHAVAFNAAGDIIGGGWDFISEPVPSGGQTTAEIFTTVSESPASVQMYATVGSLEDVVP